MSSSRCVSPLHLIDVNSLFIILRCSPMRLLRTFPALDALPVIGIAVTLVRDLPPELYDELVRHPYELQTT